MAKYCITRNCDGEIGKRSKSDLCAKCQAGLRYWDDRDPADVMERRKHLVMLNDRLGHRDPKPKKKASHVRIRRQVESRPEARAH